MPSTEKTDYAQIAHHLAKSFDKFGFVVDGKPLAYALRFDGSMSVVLANGMKFIFTVEEVARAKTTLAAKEKPATIAPTPPKQATRAKK